MRRNAIKLTAILAAGMMITNFESSERFNYVKPSSKNRFNQPTLRGRASNRRYAEEQATAYHKKAAAVAHVRPGFG